MTGDDIVAGKGGFQKADLMDYGSLYGMGSYYGEDYTASTLVALGYGDAEQCRAGHVRQAVCGADGRSAGRRRRRDAPRAARRGLDQAGGRAVRRPLADALVRVRDDLAKSLNTANPAAGWTPAYSLTPPLAVKTADFLVFSALTTVARRPGTTWSWTENWPYEPHGRQYAHHQHVQMDLDQLLLHLLRLRRGLFIYEFFLNNPDDAPMDPVLATFRPLTPSQRRIGKYFLVVAALLLVQIAAGIDHGAFLLRSDELLRHRHQRLPAVQLPARRPYPGADHLDWAVLDRRGAVPGTRHRRRPGSQRPALAGGFPVLGHARWSSPVR